MKLAEALSLLRTKIHEELSPFKQHDGARGTVQVILRRSPTGERFVVLNQSLDPLLFHIHQRDFDSIEEECFTLADQQSCNWETGHLRMSAIPDYVPLKRMYLHGLLYARPQEATA